MGQTTEELVFGAHYPTDKKLAAEASAVHHVSELERIIEGIEYSPAQAGFPNGWPHIARPQPHGEGNVIVHNGVTYTWIATGSRGGGFYTDTNLSKPIENVMLEAFPYELPGVLAVITAVGNEHQRQEAWKRLEAYGDGWQDIGNTNAEADPKFNAALSQVLNGFDVQTAYNGQLKGVGANYGDPEFTVEQLQAAADLAKSL